MLARWTVESTQEDNLAKRNPSTVPPYFGYQVYFMTSSPVRDCGIWYRYGRDNRNDEGRSVLAKNATQTEMGRGLMMPRSFTLKHELINYSFKVEITPLTSA